MVRNKLIMREVEASLNKKAGVNIKGKKRTKKDVEARMMFSYLMKSKGIGVTEISKYMLKSISTVQYYIKTYDEWLKHDIYWKSMYEIHEDMIENRGGSDLTLLLFIKHLQKRNKKLTLELESIKENQDVRN